MAKRVLGQLLRKPKVVRMSGEDAGPKEWRPDFSQSPIVHEHHGWVHGPGGAVKEEDPGHHFPADMFGDRNHEWVALKRLIHNDNPKAVRSNPTLQVSGDEESRSVRPPRLTHFYLDSQGNTTAHSGPQHDRMYSGSHLEYNEAIPRVSRQDYWDWLKLHHDDAVAKGQVYHRVAIHPQWEAFIREANKDPELTKAMAHDWALENGYDDLAEAMKADGMLYPGHAMMRLGGKTPDWLRDDVKAYKASQMSLNGQTVSRNVLGRTIQMAAPPPVDMRHRYHPVRRPTDLSEWEWMAIKRHFPKYEASFGRVTPIRVYLNATLYRLETGTPLRKLPPDFPRWGSVHSVEDRIAKQGLWPLILQETGRTHLLPALKKMIHGAVEPPAGGLMPKVHVAAPMQMSHGEHSYGCVHVNLPPPVASWVLAFAAQIPDDELAADGRETSPHVTVLYGLKPRVGPEDVKAALSGCKPAHYSLGKLGLFPGDKCEVLYASVDSKDLAALNAAACRLDHEQMYGGYVPHVTVAYLKKGMGSKYLSQDPFSGVCCCADQVVFSPKGGADTFVNLTGDRLPGGLADSVPPGTFGKAEAEGAKVEAEHTSDHQVAAEIARDHLTEDPGYYKKLAAVGLSLDYKTVPTVPTVPGKKAVRKRVLGRVIQMAVEGEEAAAKKPDFSKSLVVPEFHGWIHEQEVPVRQPSHVAGSAKQQVMDPAGMAVEFGTRALADGDFHTHDYDADNRRRAYLYHDKEGRTTAHVDPAADAQYNRIFGDLESNPQPSNTFRDWLKQRHEAAVAQNKLYHQVHVHPQWEGFVREGEPHMAHDWAMENGHQELADAIRAMGFERAAGRLGSLGAMEPERLKKIADHWNSVKPRQMSVGEKRILGKVFQLALPLGFVPLDTQFVLDHDRQVPRRAGFYFPANEADVAARKAAETQQPVASAAPYEEGVVHVFADPEGYVTAHVSRKAQGLRAKGAHPGSEYHAFLEDLHRGAKEAGKVYKKPDEE